MTGGHNAVAGVSFALHLLCLCCISSVFSLLLKLGRIAHALPCVFAKVLKRQMRALKIVGDPVYHFVFITCFLLSCMFENQSPRNSSSPSILWLLDSRQSTIIDRDALPDFLCGHRLDCRSQCHRDENPSCDCYCDHQAKTRDNRKGNTCKTRRLGGTLSDAWQYFGLQGRCGGSNTDGIEWRPLRARVRCQWFLPLYWLCRSHRLHDHRHNQL